MTVDRQVRAAHEAWAKGDGRRALAHGWDAVNGAMDHGIDEVLQDIGALAGSIARATGGRLSTEAQQLADYCRHCLAGVGNGAQAPGILGLISGWRRRRTCPDCAERIAKEARVCPHCGYRLADPPQRTAD